MHTYKVNNWQELKALLDPESLAKLNQSKFVDPDFLWDIMHETKPQYELAWFHIHLYVKHGIIFHQDLNQGEIYKGFIDESLYPLPPMAEIQLRNWKDALISIRQPEDSESFYNIKLKNFRLLVLQKDLEDVYGNLYVELTGAYRKSKEHMDEYTELQHKYFTPFEITLDEAHILSEIITNFKNIQND